jgi:small subunit ribosomal protein S1
MPKVPVPSRRGPLPDDLQAEIDEALGGLSLEDVIAGRTAPDTGGRLENESRHRGQVVEVHGDNVFFTLGGKNQGIASLRQFKEPPQPGDVIDVIVTGFNPEDSLHDLSIPGGNIVVGDWSDIGEGSLVEARVIAANTGGLECQVNNIRAFIPASQVGLYRVENLGDLVGQKLVCVVTESNERRGDLVLSRRAVLEREKEESKKQTLAELEVGAMREGIVRKLHDFGAFVDLGGVDGLIHISQLAWDRVKHPSEVVQEGQKVRVRIEKVDPETGKISLSLKNPEEHPWTGIEQRFPVGSTATGTVSRIAEFGAFVKLAPGVEGLIHISELAHHKVYRVENVVNEGQEVEVKIVSVDAEAQRIGLSLKALAAAPQRAEKKKPENVEAPDAPPRPLAVPKRGGPLRGGVGKSSGGDQFGLRW